MNTAINIGLLPPILQDLVELIGLHATMKLVQAYPGVRLYIPKQSLTEDHYLVRLLGRQATDKLQSVYGGEPHFEITKAERALKAVRNAEIRNKRPHTSVRLLALEYYLTERQIINICGECEDDRQQNFF